MAHISDELPLLLTGDATREVVMTAAAHLRSCVDCQQELVSAVIAHASLTSAHRFAPEIVASETDGALAPSSGEAPAALPDLSSLFAEVRSDQPPVGVTDDLSARRVRRRLVAVAAAAVIAGGGITAYTLTNSDGSSPSGRTVALTGTLGASTGSARLVGNNSVIVDTKLPAPAKGEQYEVWLIGSDNGRQAVGYLHDGAAQITVPGDVMQNYKGIAVSVQRDDQSEFSGKVVLQGMYG